MKVKLRKTGIMASGLLLLCLLESCGVPPTSNELAVADYDQVLGLVSSEVDIDGEQVQVWHFLLCKRAALLQNDPAAIAELLQDQEVCYNPFIDAKGGAAVYLSPPKAQGDQLKTSGRLLTKSLVVVGGTVLAFFSVKFGWRVWKWFTNIEEYIRYSQILKRAKIAKERSEQGLKKKNRALAWVSGGGVIGFLAAWVLVGDGAFTMLSRLWNINKTYFNNGKKVLLDWGQPERSYRDDYPYLVNDAWLDTKKSASIDDLLLGIKRTLDCEFSPRYLEENPTLAP